jgi:hypothetical protein
MRRQAGNGEQGLVLLGFEAGGARGDFAEIEEATDFVAEIG